MSYILVVVDMQPIFLKSIQNQDLISNCKKEINLAISNNNPIIFLELINPFINNGKTISSLFELVKNYNKAYFLEKESSSGATKILNLLEELNISNQDFRVVGSYGDCCVYDTVKDLKNQSNAHITVVSNACELSGIHNSNFEHMRIWEQVSIL